ncbi:MAG: hypothetical protein AAGA91_17975 [Pseudomonadota bacterium]
MGLRVFVLGLMLLTAGPLLAAKQTVQVTPLAASVVAPRNASLLWQEGDKLRFGYFAFESPYLGPCLNLFRLALANGDELTVERNDEADEGIYPVWSVAYRGARCDSAGLN